MRRLNAGLVMLVALLPLRGPANDIREAAAEQPDAALERRFWECDYGATRGTLPMDAGPACEAITDELKQRRFDGSFEQLLAWWQARKAAEHGKLDAAGRARRTRPVAHDAQER